MAPSQASALARGRAAYGRLLRACAVVSGLLTFAMMVLVVANALSRFFLNAPIVGTLEITESTLCVLIFLSVGFTQYEGGHIHVTLVLQRMSAGARHALALLAAVLGLAFFAWSAWSAWGFAMKSLAMNEQEWGAIRFPLYPVKFVIFAGLLLLAGQFVLDALWVIAGGRPAHDEDLAGATEP